MKIWKISKKHEIRYYVGPGQYHKQSSSENARWSLELGLFRVVHELSRSWRYCPGDTSPTKGPIGVPQAGKAPLVPLSNRPPSLTFPSPPPPNPL